MKKTAILIFTVFALLSAGASYGDVVDRIVVVVNDEIITQREIDVMLMPIYVQFRGMYQGEELIRRLEEVRERILRQLIEDRLMLSEAKKEGIVVEEKEIDSKIEEVKRQVGSEGDLENMLHDQNLTLNELRARYKEKIMVRKLIDRKVGARIIITPLEIKNYYTANKDEFLQPEQLKLRSILIKVPEKGGDQQKALDLAREIVRRVQEGGDFEALARTYSQDSHAESDGFMGNVKRGDLLPQIEEVIFKLQDGQISGIIQTPLGYYIFKVDKKLEPRSKDLQEVRQQIEELIYREKANERLKGWVENLSKNAYIEFK